MSDFYERARRHNPDSFEVEFTQFRYKALDLYPNTLYVDEQTSTVVLDPFKWEKEVIGG